MHSQSHRTLVGILLLSMVLTVPGAVAQPAPEVVERLTSLARSAVEAHNDVLISGNAQEALRKAPPGTSFEQALERHLPVISNRRAAMARNGFRYTSHRTQLTIDATDVNGGQATQRGTERVVLQLAGGGPSETEYVQEHVFEYVLEGDTWRMVSDTIVMPPPLEEEIPAPPGAAPLEDAPPGFQPDPSRRRGAGSGEPQEATLRPTDGVALASLDGAPRDLRLAATAYYNATNAVNYALKYWDVYNPDYRAYSNDCTNFTSQALRAGGWPYDETGERTASTTWYYGSFTATTSYSWAGAHNFHLFFNQSGRGFNADYFSQLIKGDIVQADWGPTPDGNISHSMVVTDVANGVAFVTYHSNDNRNRSLDDLRASNPGTRWYGLLMYGSFTY